jgi:formylglycine-generating enzyme required for sulfatase activity
VRGRLAAIALGMHTGESIQIKRTTPEAAASLDEVERILADFAQLNPATESGSIAATQRRDELLARTGLLLGRGPDKAGFCHLSFQEFLAAAHLARTRREPDWFARVVAERALVPEWRLTLVFLFGRMLERNGEQWALDAAGRLLAAQARKSVSANPAPAVLCADWLEILQRRRLNLGGLRDSYATLALEAIEEEIRLQDRFRLGVVLGRIGDPRLGDPRDPEWRKQGLVEVPAGRYAYQDGFQEIHEPFSIGRYPVTNAQFALFIEDGGYRDSQWWSEAGWTWREQEAITEPKSWRESQFNAPNQPVVGVSYWEAEAFCRWTGGRLPTEREWEAVARGPAGHEYPWGGSWENGICNTRESGLLQTSPVGLFPRSRQKELGIEDLAGNVWEWCIDSGSYGYHKLRGGCWDDPQINARAVHRNFFHPGHRVSYYGFRLVCASYTPRSMVD